MKTKRLMILAMVLAAVLILPVGAKASLIPVSNADAVYVTITATNEAGQSQAITLGGKTSLDGTTGNSVWVLDNSVSILDGSIDSLKVTVNSDPEVDIEFGFKAGNSTLAYAIYSDVVTFDPLVNPTADASAGVTLTDRGTPGATITGLFPGGKTFQATYNGSNVFANLVKGFSISGGTLTGSEDTPDQVINGTLTDIESEFYFKLSANDAASGTSTFEVVPEPATMAILGLGITVLISRRKR
ncbi:MAG: PEP-CTERM sorting domain-containing protein [Sedimentisphaerales bacterium]|jgi:hypothetical protein